MISVFYPFKKVVNLLWLSLLFPSRYHIPFYLFTTKSSSVNKVIIYKYCIALYGVPWKKEQEAWKYVTDTADGLISPYLLCEHKQNVVFMFSINQ